MVDGVGRTAILPAKRSLLTGLRQLAAALFAGCMLASAPAWAGQSLFWLQTDGASSGLGSVTNPQTSVGVGQTIPLYLWLDKDSLSYGFDGISLDVKLISSDGGSATATIAFDEPAGRWSGTTAGGTRSDSGGTGVAGCNAVDLTNTDTLSPDPLRLATVYVTGVSKGSVQVFLCVGSMGIADGGSNAVVWMGLASGSTSPDTQLINGGIAGMCSSVPEATILVTTPSLGDFDDDDDVDQDDFGHLQECLSGTLPQTDPNCADTLLNGDAFVDQTDVAMFLECMGGPDQLPPTACR